MLNETSIEVRGVQAQHAARRRGRAAAVPARRAGLRGLRAGARGAGAAFRRAGARSSGLRPLRRAGLDRRRARSRLLLSRPARRARARARVDSSAIRSAAGSRSKWRCARRGASRAWSSRPPPASASTACRAPTCSSARPDELARLLFAGDGWKAWTDGAAGDVPTLQDIHRQATASPRRSSAGSRGSSTRSSRSGCIASTGRPASCGARRIRIIPPAYGTTRSAS